MTENVEMWDGPTRQVTVGWSSVIRREYEMSPKTDPGRGTQRHVSVVARVC